MCPSQELYSQVIVFFPEKAPGNFYLACRRTGERCPNQKCGHNFELSVENNTALEDIPHQLYVVEVIFIFAYYVYIDLIKYLYMLPQKNEI